MFAVIRISPQAAGRALRVLALVLAPVLAAAAPAAARAGDQGAQIFPRLPAGQASYGGPFRLTDQHGEAFTERDLRGHYTLLYFGYTRCADICPAALYNVARAIGALGADGEALEPVFVNLDAARDSLADLDRYVTYFHPRMRGLTGPEAAIAGAAAAYRVHYARSVDGTRIDHSGAIFLIGPDGAALTFFPHGTEFEDIAATVRHHMHARP